MNPPFFKRRNCFCALFTLFTLTLFPQIYPVHISTQLVPPYSGYLADYADPSSEKLKIILQFNDFSIPQYNLRLKIEIKGNGFTLSTRQFYHPPPLTLQPGVPLLLTGADLAPYLNSTNLDFTGLNKSQYEQRMALPEGHYSICVKAYDYYNPGNIQVSSEACAQAWFTESDPPFLNLPLCSNAVSPQTPQNIQFQWTPMNNGSPNSAGTTEYEFALWEIRPDSSVNPNQVVMSVAPVYSITTNLTMLNYGISEPPLNLYMKYAWRVREKDISGRDWFKNNGYSQVCTFVYGTASTVLGSALTLNLSAQGVTHRMGICTWNTQSLFDHYTLQVRKAGTLNWFNYPTTVGNEKVTNLEPNTSYEAQVRGESGAVSGSWSNIATFRTQSEPSYNCNDQTILNNPLQSVPLSPQKAIAGLIIQSGQFEIVATQLNYSGTPGWYSGTGIAKVFGMLPLAVTFSNIYIDDNNTHVSGTIQALTKGIGNWVHQWDVNAAEQHASYVEGTIDSAYISGNQACVIIQGSANAFCVPLPPDSTPVVIRDGNGNQYLFEPPDKISGPTNYFTYSTDALAASDSLNVTFSESPDQLYGFDKKQYTAWINHYENIKLSNGKSYFVPYKSIGNGQSDEVFANVQIFNFSAGQLSFKTKSGQSLSALASGSNQYKVTVPSTADAVYAWYGAKKIGKLNITPLKPLSKKVMIVPVNNASLNVTDLENRLNKIYRQANVSWTISMKPGFSFAFDSTNNGLDVDDVTLMKKYSREMRNLRNAYQQFDSAYTKDAFYLFVVNSFHNTGNTIVQGFMPRGRAAGFISRSATEKTIAHELSHGAFGLEHSFPEIAMNSTANLMDYANGTELSKLQWDLMQNSPPVFSWRDDEEDVEYSRSQAADNITIFETLKTIKRCVNENKTMPVTQFANSYYASYLTEKVYLAGIQYDYIRIYKDLGNTQKTSISPKNNIVSQQKTAHNAGTGQDIPYGQIVVDNVFFVEVPVNRLSNMEYYLKSPDGKNLILFVSGYRSNLSPTFEEFPNSDNKVSNGDVYNYWSGLDADFINRIGTKKAVYADGHHGIVTSNHVRQDIFLTSLAS
ncbi:MAG: fibronectin type III domain-containing protein, partial [Bacteroidia bacterium]